MTVGIGALKNLTKLPKLVTSVSLLNKNCIPWLLLKKNIAPKVGNNGVVHTEEEESGSMYSTRKLSIPKSHIFNLLNPITFLVLSETQSIKSL